MEPLKNLISEKLILQYADEIHALHASFDRKSFLNAVLNEQWEERELKDRINHLAITIHEHMQLDFNQEMEVLEQVAANLPTGFEFMVLPTVVEKYGLDEVTRSLKAIHWLTRFSTGEFAIRPFIKADPKGIMDTMLKWSKDENEHVRRLSSEGCRPRLPWGGNLKMFQNDPAPILPILENLKSDPSLYVRKSVANNLNDISKDNPEMVLDIAERWMKKATKETQWIVKHALRGLLKQPHPRALELFGYGNPEKVVVRNLRLDQAKPKMGDTLNFDFEVEAPQTGKLRIEYIIYYQKKNGKQAPKVFQVSEGEWKKGEKRLFSKKQSLADMTTRKHHPGLHDLRIRVNGEEKTSQEFTLMA
ncbi:DNA alkylation repair protein [bacterium SCSIO 12741]|nr:DNA alkylation repair protein [bacterium SCSIO 12741]